MSSPRKARIGRLLADLRRPETRGDAVRRVSRRVVSIVRGRIRGSSADGASAASGSGHRPDAWFVQRWVTLAGAVLGRDVDKADRDGAAIDAPQAESEARRARGRAMFAEAIGRGEPLERAIVSTVAALTETLDWNSAWALAEGVGRLPDGKTSSALGHLVLLHRRKQLGRAWRVAAGIDDRSLATFAPVEAVDAALGNGSPEARVRAMTIAAPTADMDAAILVDLAGRFLAVGERDHASALVRQLRRRASIELDPRRRHALGLIEDWLDPRPTAVPAGAVRVAVMDYQSPDHTQTSGNLGDYVQSLALIGNLARMSDVRFSGDGGLGAFATELQDRVRPDLRRPDVGGAMHLLAVDRDFSDGATLPDGTWLIAHGWHMHSLFELRYDFPYHSAVRPIFVSFHINRLDLLTERAKAYLRDHGPVGCRDWDTVFLLLSAGIDAFFTGCLTTTVDAVFPTRDAVHRAPGVDGVIDLPASSAGRGAKQVRTYSHQADAYRYMTLTDGLRAASTTLAAYQRDLDHAVTGRLHAYLPLTTLGVPVDFKPRSTGDIRFAGLTGLRPDDERLSAMRDGLRELLATVFDRMLGGASPEEIYATWRELTRDRVAEAKARLAEPVTDPPTTIDVAAAAAFSLAGSRRSGPHAAVDPAVATDVVLAYDQNLTHPAAVLIESMLANTSGPLRLWILGRGLSEAYQAWLAAAFPSLPITFVPCDRIVYGPLGRPRRITGRITISTMDRLLLPAILPDVSRVVYVDVDTLMLGDVAELARTDLGGHPVAARDSYVSEADEWRRAATRLPEDEATGLRRRMAAAHGYGGAALNAGVLVLDLDRLRRDDFAATYLGLVERYGLNDQDTMLAFVGPERAVLPPEWNALPVFEDVADPKLIHWASLGKPWEPDLTYAQDRWRVYAGRLAERAGAPPPSDAAGKSERTLPEPVQIGPVTSPLHSAVERVIEAVRGEHLTYLDAVSLRTLAAAVLEVERDGVEGLIIEAGTARGGSAITMAAAKSPARPMRVYDTFGMIPRPSDKDGADVHRRYATIVSGKSAGIAHETYYGYREGLLAEVTESFARHGVPVEATNVELIQGLFESTIELDGPVALAHLDGDWYASTMTCLMRIAPRLSVGGRIIVDDYDTWSGCRIAVDEYFADRRGYRFERRGRLHIVRE